MGTYRLTLLGGFEARLPSGRVVTVPGGKAHALLAYLAMRPGQSHRRDALAALLWTDSARERARQSLRQTVLTLRQALPQLLPEGEALAVDPALLDVDVAAFERAIDAGKPEDLQHAAALYRGELLAGLSNQEAPFEEWLLSERERLRELVLEALAKLLAHQVKSGAVEPAIHSGARLLSLDPLQEPVHRALMQLYSQQGRQGAALRQYQMCVSALDRELGVGPEAETRQLYQDILQRRGTRAARGSSARAPSAGVSPEAIPAETPLIGRDAELARLRRAFEEARGGHGRLVVVAGEAGIGKTRFVTELASEAARANAAVVIASAFATTKILPFGPWVDVLRSGPIARDGGIIERLDPYWRAELGRLLPELAGPSVQPSADVGRLFEAVFHILTGLAAGAPALVILEDLQWADEMTIRLVGFLARKVPASRVLLIATVREEDVPDTPVLGQLLQEMARDSRQLLLSLPPLSREGTLELVRALVRVGHDTEALERLGEQIWVSSEGNPFTVVETVRAVRPGAEPEPSGGPPLPERVRELIDSRLERLDSRSREVVRVAAVIGRAFPFALLQRAADLSPHEAAEIVEELVGRRVLHAVDEHLDFCHDWIRRVAYERLSPPKRALLHAAVAETLEGLQSERLDEVAQQLGYHFSKAGDLRRAFPHLLRFAELAVQRYALADALTALRQAEAGVTQLPAAERDRRTLDLVLRQAFTLSLLGRHQELVDRLASHADLLERTADPALASDYYFRLALTRLYFCEQAEAWRAAELALREGERCGDDGARAGKALHVLSLAATVGGRPHEAIEYAARAVSRLDLPHTQHYLALAYYDSFLAHVFAGDLGPALEAVERCGAIGRATQDTRLQGYAGYAAWVYVLRGDVDEALMVARKALEVSPERMTSGANMGFLGQAYLEAGDPAAAVRALEEAVATLASISLRWVERRFTALLAEAYLLAGDPLRARDTAERALTLSATDGVPFNAALSQRVLGRIARAAGERAEAEQRLTTALKAFTECGAAFEVARTRVDLAAFRAAEGDRDQAAEHLASALSAFEAAGAPRRVAAVRRLAESLGVELSAGAAARVSTASPEDR